MLIFHIAERSRWEAAKLAGSYAWSTLEEPLEQVGYIHASREDQWEAVLQRHYADVRTPLVLLAIDTDRLTSPWREDPVLIDGVATTYPHIHGPLNPSAVVEARPLSSLAEPSRSFFQLLLGEMAYRMLAAVAVMLVTVLVLLGLSTVVSDRIALVGALAVAVAGTLVAVRLYPRFVRS